MDTEADKLFKLLDTQLAHEVDAKFFIDPKIYKSLIDVVAIVNSSMENRATNDTDIISALNQNNDLLKQCHCVLSVIDRVVKFQHGGLNNSVDTMGEVLRSYNSNRIEVQMLRTSLLEARNVLTQKKQGQIALKELYLQKIEAEESLRILDLLGKLKDAPSQVLRCIQQRQYVGAASSLNSAIENMFNDDVVGISALDPIRQQLMEMKGAILEAIVSEVKNIILGDFTEEVVEKKVPNDEISDSVSDMSYGRGSSMISKVNGTKIPETLEDEWSSELSKITEEFERSLPTPAFSKPLFARLLVRAVGMLNCEDDIDRFLLEEGSIKFQTIVKNVREKVHNVMTNGGVVDAEVQNISPDNDTAKNFTIYASILLDKAVAVLKRLLHVLRLLNISKNKLDTEKVGKEVDLSLKKATGASVLDIWGDIERIIYHELQAHFVEQSVEQISDKTAVSRQNISLRRTSFDKTKRMDSTGDDDDPGDALQLDELPPLFPPSSHLSATIYKQVVAFSEQAYALLSADISFELLVEADKRGNSVRVCNIVLDLLKQFLQDELMPVVQGAVNREMRDIQLSNELFLAPVTVAPEALKGGDVRPEVPVCRAGRKIFDAIGPLFPLYLELPQHRDATLTILDRGVRGFVSAAREEAEAISFKWRTAGDAQLRAVVGGMVADPLFVTYRRYVYEGKESVEDLAQPPGSKLAATAQSTATRRGSRLFTNASMASLLQAAAAGVGVGLGGSEDGVSEKDDKSAKSTDRGNAREQDSWGDLWSKIGGSSVQYGADRFADDYEGIGKIAAIARASDWMVNQLFKRLNQLNKPKRMSGKKSSHSALSSAAFAELRTVIQRAALELAKLAEECMALLRGELQMSCFHYLHSLAHMRTAAVEQTRSATFISKNMQSYSADDNDTNNNNSSNNSKGKVGVESEVVIAALHNHMFSFQRAVLTASSPQLMVVLLSPLCSVIPKILSQCAKQLSSAAQKETAELQDYEYESMKTRFLRAISACQHLLSALLEDGRLDPRSHRLLQDIASEDFEVTRRIADIIDHPSPLTFISSTLVRTTTATTNIPVPVAMEARNKLDIPPRPPSSSSNTSSSIKANAPTIPRQQPPPTPAVQDSSPPQQSNKIEQFFGSVAAKFQGPRY